jgi:integrase
VEREADELLKAAGLPALDHAGAEFGRLCRRLLQANIEYTRIERDRWNGEEPYKRVNHVASRVATQVATPTTVKAGPLFSVVADKYLKENPKGERTAKPFRAELKKFVESIGGDRPVASITKEDGRTYKDHLMNVRKLGLHTVMKHVSSLVAVFRWAESQGYIPDGSNPVKGLAPNKKVVKKSMLKRRPFTDQELLTVLGSKKFLAQRTKHPDRWWIVLLCLFTAARREEAAQLVLADIQEEDGIPFIRINDDAKLDQHLKNEGSRRRVPIDSALIRLGFLEYVESIRKAGHTRLFPDLVKGHNGYADPVGKWFGRLVTACGLHDPELVLHGLRHGAITKLHAAGVADDVVKMLVGHVDQTVHGQTYVHRHLIPLSLLREGSEKLRYDDVEKTLL